MSKIISHSRLEAVRRWEPPDMEDEAPEPDVSPGEPAGPPRDLPTLEQIEAIQREAQEEGYAAGYQAGYRNGQQEGAEAARHEITAEVARLAAVLDRLAQPLADLDESVEAELAGLAADIARHVLRHELDARPEAIAGVVREAAALLPSSRREVRLRLHPDDAALVREHMPVETAGWQVQEDPTLSRGGCRLGADPSEVDATVEARLRRAVEAALGGGDGGA